MSIVALDVDFKKIYAVTDGGEVLLKASPEIVWPAILENDTILMEVSSPVMYIRDIKVVYNVVKWALWNMAIAQRIDSAVQQFSGTPRFLVAPSHVWTCGHPLKVRHEVAKCVQKQKDLRECEAMIYYYKQDPSKWVPLTKYLENL